MLFSSIELNEILCNRAQQFCFEKESEKEFQYKSNEQKSSKRGVVAVNYAELLGRNRGEKIRSGAWYI